MSRSGVTHVKDVLLEHISRDIKQVSEVRFCGVFTIVLSVVVLPSRAAPEGLQRCRECRGRVRQLGGTVPAALRPPGSRDDARSVSLLQ